METNCIADGGFAVGRRSDSVAVMLEKRPMAFRFQLRSLLAAALFAALSSAAAAVEPLGNKVRVDKDPGTAWYGFFAYHLTPGLSGGFAVGWEEDTKQDEPFFPIIEGAKFRVFTNALKPVAEPGSPDDRGRKGLGLGRLTTLGSKDFDVIYTVSRKIDKDTNQREAYGQKVKGADGVADPRRLLNNTDNSAAGGFFSRSAGLADGRVLFAWYDGQINQDTVVTIPARFIAANGVPGPVNLDLAVGDGFALLDIVRHDDGFLAFYRRSSSPIEYRARAFKSNGKPRGPVHTLDAGNGLTPYLAAFSNGRILTAKWVSNGSDFDLVGQVHSKAWATIGPTKKLVAGTTSSGQVIFAPTPDGGMLLGRTFQNPSTYSHTVTAFDDVLKRQGAVYTFPSEGFDSFRIAALTATNAIAVFKTRVGGRLRLVVQKLKI